MVRYAGTVVAIAGLALACGWLARDRLAPAALGGAALGIALAALGAIGGMALTAWAFARGQRAFFAALVTGILGRLFVYGAALVYVALKTSVDSTATAVALLGSYVAFQIVEVRFALVGLAGRRAPG
jgi:hypothetical protein